MVRSGDPVSLIPYVHVETGALAGAPQGAVIDLPADARERLHRVLRLQAGAPIMVADGEGRESAAVLGVGTAVLEGPQSVQAAPRPRLHLVQAMAKGRKVDDVVRSATELGVDRITLVGASRSEVRPAADKRDRLTARWRAIAHAASEQSRRPFVPEVNGPLPLGDVVSAVPEDGVGLAAHPGSQGRLRDVLGTFDVRASSELVIFIGPEGGWADDELVTFEHAGLHLVALGPSVLRTEHAGHAVCAVAAYELGRMA